MDQRTWNLRPSLASALTVFACIAALALPARAQSLSTVDYSDTFTLGVNGRANGVCCTPGPYAVEDTNGNAAATWTRQDVYSFNDIPGSFGAGPVVLAAAAGNPGAATGLAQSGGGDFSFAYGLRTNYMVKMDAILSPGDRTDMTSGPSPGGGIFEPGSLSVFFRKTSRGNMMIGIYNAAAETTVASTGLDDDHWHKLAVHFNQDADRLVIYVDGVVKADLDLATFAGGAYRSYSNGAVGAGGAGAFVDSKVLWFDNFEVGAPPCELIKTVDYSDTFTVGAGGRPDGFFGSNAGGEYNVENLNGNPATTWTPFTNFSFNSGGGSTCCGYPTNTGNSGAATGLGQSGSGDFSFAYGLRSSYVVSVDAILPLDRLDISSLPAPGAGIFSAPSLSVFFRRDGAGAGISIFNGSTDTTVLPTLGVSDRIWHNYAVHFDQAGDRLEMFVDGVSKAAIDLATFAGGIYENYSNAAVGTGGEGYDFVTHVLWVDNFRVGSSCSAGDALACFTVVPGLQVTHCPIGFDAGCSRTSAGAITSYEWDFGDGGMSSGPAVEHTYTTGGTFPVTLTIEDEGGNTAVVSRDVAVAPVALSYADDFQRPDGPPSGWTVFSGATWRLGGGKLLSGPSGPEHWIWAGSPPLFAPPEAFFTFDYSFLAPGTVGAVGRHGGFQFHCSRPTQRGGGSAFSGYFIDWIDRAEDRGVRLTRVDNGAFTLLVPGQGAAAPPNPPLRYLVIVSGPRIQVFGDDRLYIDIADDTHRGGFFGMWTWEGGQEVSVDNVTMTGEALGPCFDFDPASPLAGDTVHFDADCSKVFGGGSTIVSFEWDFGDGQTANGAAVDHAYASADVYTVTLTVEDSLGREASTSRLVSVAASLEGFIDCFDRPAGPVDGWTPSLGTWNITAGGQVETMTAGSEAFLYAGSPAGLLPSNFTAEVDWTFLGGTHPVVGRHGAVHFFWNVATADRFAANSNGYAVFYIDRASDRGLTLARWDGAALSILNPPGGTPAFTEPPATLRIEVSGPMIRVFADGMLAIEAADETYRTGLFAVWSWLQNHIQFDNVRIWNAAEPDRCGTTRHLAGDCNLDGRLDIADVVCHVGALFPGFFILPSGSPELPCAGGANGPGNLAILDLNADGRNDVSDIVRLATYLFQNGPPPAQGLDCFSVAPELDCRMNPSCP